MVGGGYMHGRQSNKRTGSESNDNSATHLMTDLITEQPTPTGHAHVEGCIYVHVHVHVVLVYGTWLVGGAVSLVRRWAICRDGYIRQPVLGDPALTRWRKLTGGVAS